LVGHGSRFAVRLLRTPRASCGASLVPLAARHPSAVPAFNSARLPRLRAGPRAPSVAIFFSASDVVGVLAPGCRAAIAERASGAVRLGQGRELSWPKLEDLEPAPSTACAASRR
jgi:hypothetical protein